MLIIFLRDILMKIKCLLVVSNKILKKWYFNISIFYEIYIIKEIIYIRIVGIILIYL